MAARSERGEWYNCSEKFSQEHLKVCPMNRVFLMQLYDAWGYLRTRNKMTHAPMDISPTETLKMGPPSMP
jgi:hypothetical protein